MTTTTITQTSPATTSRDQARPPKAIRSKIIGAVIGASALAAITAGAVDNGGSGPGDRIPATSLPAASVQQLQWGQTPGGCLSDIECYGGAAPTAVD